MNVLSGSVIFGVYYICNYISFLFFFIWTASESRLESFLERQNNFHLNFEFKDAHENY